jgi:type II secretion system protein I
MNRKGFTLLEALVALTVLGLVGVSAVGVIGSDLRAASRMREGLTEVAVAEEILARVSLLDGNALTSLPDSLRRGELILGDERYEWRTESREQGTHPNLVEVSVTVTSTSGSRGLTTVLRRGP